MKLNIDKWVQEDKKHFLEYLKTLGTPEKRVWATNISKTQSPVLVIQTPNIVRVANEIMKGNYISFLNLGIDDYYETIALYGIIITRMESFDEFLVYLNNYLDYMNCWAHCDLLKFPFLLERSEVYLDLSKKYSMDQRVMVRRLSLFILFQYVKK